MLYYGKLKLLWDELSNFDQIPVCVCAGCRCNLTIELEKKREEEKVHQFLMGLDVKVYGTLRSNVLSTEPLPNLNRVYAMAIQEERVRAVTQVKEEREPISFAVQANLATRTTRAQGKECTCTECRRTGHDSENCFEVIGYPEWWGDRPKTAGRGASRGRGGSTSYGSRGRGRNANPRVNVAQAAHVGVTHEDVTDADKVGLGELSDDQWNVLLNLLNSHKTSSNEKLTGMQNGLLWIIDSGASHYMTGSLDYMTDLHDIPTCPVGMPNGDMASALKERKISFGGHMKLRNVLYVPSLKCNLIRFQSY